MPAKDMERRRIRQHKYRQTQEYKEQRRESPISPSVVAAFLLFVALRIEISGSTAGKRSTQLST